MLKRAPLRAFKAFAYRVIDDEFRGDPLSGIGSIVKGGRYNAPGKFEALYCADSRVTALYEVGALFGDIDQPRSPELILSLAVTLSNLLDLTDTPICEELGLTETDLVAPFLEEQVARGEALTQRLGRLVFEAKRFSGLYVPSAARQESENIVILPARFASDESVRLHDDRGRWRQVRVGPPA